MVLVESTMVTFFIDFAFLLTSTNCYSIKKSEIKEKLENNRQNGPYFRIKNITSYKWV